jgi:ABC-type metal ion transport system substrate-binding protein
VRCKVHQVAPDEQPRPCCSITDKHRTCSRLGRIAQEPIADNPYRNFIAVKEDNKDADWVKTLVSSYQNDTVKAEFDSVYKGTGLSAY